MEKNFYFFATEDRSQDLIYEYFMHYPLFLLVFMPATSL